MRTSLALVLALCGCAAPERPADPYTCVSAGGAGCFELPSHPLTAVDADGRPTPAVLDCAAYQAIRSPAPVMLAGKTLDAVDHAAIGLVDIELFAEPALATPIGEVISDDVGTYSLTIDAMPSELFARTRATGALPVHLLYQRLDPAAARHDMFDLLTTTRANVDAMLASVGDALATGTSQLTGRAYDCAGNRLVDVVANVAPEPGEPAFEDGVRVYYEAEGPDHPLGRRSELAETSPAGGFAATHLAPGHHVVQLWGFADAGALARGRDGLALVGEAAIVVPEDDAWLVAAIHAGRR